MCAGGGIHLFTLLDWYSGSWSLLVLALLEVGVVGWVFGADRLLALMQDRMQIWIPGPLRIYWRVSWRYVSPLCIIVSGNSVIPQLARYHTGHAKHGTIESRVRLGENFTLCAMS